MYSTHPKTYFNFAVTLILSSANAFNLDQFKKLVFGKGLGQRWRTEQQIAEPVTFNSIKQSQEQRYLSPDPYLFHLCSLLHKINIYFSAGWSLLFMEKLYNFFVCKHIAKMSTTKYCM